MLNKFKVTLNLQNIHDNGSEYRRKRVSIPCHIDFHP